MDEVTTIRLQKITRDKIAEIGTKDDSFEDIVNRLADFWIRYKKIVEGSTVTI